MALASFSIVCEAGRPATIEVNGEPLDPRIAVLGLSLRADGPAPVLTLLVAGEGVLEGQGIVQVTRESQEDYGAELRRLVAEVDAEEWNTRALAHSDGMGSSPGEAFKAALLEMLG